MHAVCGSGKTEIVLEVIKYAIECGDNVGFAVPRRDVCIELHERFSSIFKRNKVSLIYGGHKDNLEGDLGCLTTHQLYRYIDYFDLLIVDEVDAFPFKGNDVLNSLFFKSIKGRYIMMSATPDDELLKSFKKPGFAILELFSRFHEHTLPIPKIEQGNKFSIYYLLVRKLKDFEKKNKQVFIFCPTIQMCDSTYKFLKSFFKNLAEVHSKKIDRQQIIQDFKNQKYEFLVTTAVLERGVTVKDLQVIVFQADHKIYDRYSLVQIAGRVGRKKDAPDGKVYFLANEKSKDMEEAINTIMESNKHL